MGVVDVLNEVGNNFAISSDGIATALQDSASSLMAANNSYQESVALIAAANRVVQDPNSVGAALRTISLRLRGTSTEELAEAGEDTDGAITSKSKLRSKIKGYTGIDILTDSGAYKSTYEILLEISKVWDDLTDMNRAGLLEMIAGKTRSNTAAAILSNTKDLEAAYKSAMEAEGSALEENEKYLDSIQGRIDLFTNAVQTMWNTELDSGIIKFFVNFGTGLVKIVDNLGLINTLVFGLMSYLTIFRKQKLDLASIMGIHDINDGWFHKRKKKRTQESVGVPSVNFTPVSGEQIDIFSDEIQTQAQINEKIKQLNTAKSELKSLQTTKWKDIQIPDDALEYKTGNRKRAYVNEVLIPKKQAEIVAIQKDIDDITLAAKIKLDQSKMKLREDTDGQMMFDFDEMSQEADKVNTKYLDIFQNGLGKGATEKLDVNFDELARKLKDLDGLDGEGLRNYMLNLDDLGDVSEDTKVALAGYVSTVEDGNYTIQGAQRYVKQYNQNLAAMSKEATKAQIKQNLLNLAISAAAMAISALITWGINQLSKVQDKFEELSSELSSVTSELQSLETELDNINEQIKELQEQGTLSLTDREELNRLEAESAELERQIDLKETLQKQTQKQMNQNAPKAAEKYYKNTGKNTGKTTGELAGQGAQYGLMAGGAVGGAIISGAVAAGTANIWNPVGWALLAVAALTAVGAAVGATIGATEEKVGDSIDNMQEKYSILQKEYEDAQTKYKDTLKDKDYDKAKKAQDKLIEFEGDMATYLAEMNAYYSQMDWETATDEERKAMQDFYDTQDKWAITSGGKDAKVNAITRIFGEHADDDLKRIKREIEDVVTAENWDGQLDLSEYFNAADLEAFTARLREMGIYVFEVENYFKDMAEAEKEAAEISLYGVATDINKITEGLENLKSAFDEVLESGSVTAKTLTELNKVFGSLGDSWNNYVNTMFSGVSSTKEMQEATEALAKAFIDSKILTGEAISEYERMTYIIQLRNLGIENAEEYVDDHIREAMYDQLENEAEFTTDAVKKEWLKRNSDKTEEDFDKLSVRDQHELAEEYGLGYGKINIDRAREVAEEYGVELENNELEENIALIEKKIKLENELADIKKQQEEYDEWLNGDEGYKATKEKLDALINTSEAVATAINDGKTFDDIYSFDSTQWQWDTDDDGNSILKHIYNEQTLTADQYSNMIQAHSDVMNAEFLDTYNELQSRLTNLIKEGENQGYIVNGEVIDPDYKEKIDEAQGDLDEFKNKIETELTADVKLKLELQGKSDLVDKMQNIFDTLADAEKEYNENKGYVSVDTLQSLLELEPKYLTMLYDENGQLNLNKETILQVAQARTLDMGIQAAQNVITQASEALEQNKIDRLRELTQVTYDQADSNWALVSSNLAVFKSAVENRNADPTDEMYGKLGGVYEGVENQVLAIQRLTNQSVANIANSFSSSGNTAKAATEDATEKQLEKFNKEMDYWENRIGANQARYEQIQNEIDLLESQGKIAGEDYYKEQIELENERLRLLEQQRAAAKSYLGTFKEGSDEWWEVANTLNDLEADIDDVTMSIQELNDAMAEIDWTVFEETTERFSNLHDELSDIRDILSNEDMFTDEGEWTEAGVATLGTYIQEIEMYKNELTELDKTLKDFEKGYAGNEAYFKAEYGIDSEQEYYDRYNELTTQQREYIKGIAEAEQATFQMYEDQVDAIEEYTDKLVDSYNEYIDIVKEALDAERDLYEFKKNIQKQTKDISQLERRISALSGSDNAADIAERRKLQAELAEAKEGLDDTYYDHAKDAQSQALDDEAAAYEESMTNYVGKLRTTLEQAKLDMDTFLAGVTSAVMLNADTVATKYDETGLAISEDLTTPWTKAAEAMSGYETDGLSIMNQWTTQEGYFGKFQTNATNQLSSPWTAGKNALTSFQNDVKTKMEGVVATVRQNVAAAKAELSSLYSGIQDTSVKPPATPSGNNGSNVGGGITFSKADVKALQEVINKVFDFSPKLIVDGIYGSRTQWAIQKIQDRYLTGHSTGKYDAKTKQAIEKHITTYFGNMGRPGDAQIWKKKLPAPFYAKGTLGTTRDELAITDESWIGEEITLAAGKNGQLQYLKKGSAVMPADISANLVEWGKLNPDMMKVGNGTNVNMISNAVNKPEFKLTFDALVKAEKITEDTLPEVKRFVQTEINRLVKQMNYALKGAGSR